MKLFDFNKNRQQIAQLRPRLLRLALSWCGQMELAEDLVQETVARALKSHVAIKDHSKINSWVFTILSNCYRDCLRKKISQESYEESIDEHALTPEEHFQQNQTSNKVRIAISQLPDNQRIVITLVDLEEFSYTEVAQILDIPVGTVMSRLNRARNLLKPKLLHQDSAGTVFKPHLERVK